MITHLFTVLPTDRSRIREQQVFLSGWCLGGAMGVGAIVSLHRGDAILLTTDGVWEAVNTAGKRYGKDRIRAALAANGKAPPRRIIDAILEDVETYTAGAPAADDFTLVVLKRLG